MSDRGEEDSWWERFFHPGRYRSCVECGTPTKNSPTSGVVTCDDCQTVMPGDETPYDAAMDDDPKPAVRRVDADDSDGIYEFDGSDEERKKSNRRWVLGALVVAGGFVVLGACTGDQSDEPDNEEADKTDDGPKMEVLRDEVIYSQERWPHEFAAGTQLVAEMKINRGGPGTFIFNEMDPKDWVEVEDIRHRVDTDKRMEWEVTTEGLLYFEIVPGDEAEVTVWVEAGGEL